MVAGRKDQVLWHGAVIWECPERMKAHIGSRVVLRVAKQRVDDFERGLDLSISRRKFGIDVATTTEAELAGEDFGIIGRQIGARQSVGEIVYREWIWEVTPKSSGRHRLLITVSPKIQAPEIGEIAVGEPFRDSKDIEVDVNWAYFLREMSGQWLTAVISAIIGAIVGSVVTWFGRRMGRVEKAPMRSNREGSTPDPPLPPAPPESPAGPAGSGREFSAPSGELGPPSGSPPAS